MLLDIYRRSCWLHHYPGGVSIKGRIIAECAKAIARIKAGAPAPSIDHMAMVMMSMMPVMTAVMSPAIMIHSVIPVIPAIPSVIHPSIIAAAISTVSPVSVGQ